jgi:hypothetical protein
MTEVADPVLKRGTAPAPHHPTDRRPGRWAIVIALIGSLVACGLAGGWASDWKEHHAGLHPVAAERGALSGMNSYTLALMLGGLRGPLVMILWSKVENQKIDRDLEDVDTMIEWIRLLQPEFDTVHIFQIWNKAYNISALMASTASKYTTILDAADYARRVDAERPGDLNILDSLAQIFGEKLGSVNSGERVFYRRQFRDDSMTEENRQKTFPEDKDYHRMGFKFLGPKNGPLLDAENNIAPELLAVRFPRPSDLPAGSEWNDGSEFQYLRPFQPFPYGLSPTALGYNYAKRAQVAMIVGGQKPIQLSEQVIDTRPGLMLKQWAEREQEQAINSEGRAFDKSVSQFESQVFDAPVILSDPVKDPRALEQSVYGFKLTATLCTNSLAEYDRHLRNTRYVNAFQTYTSHLDELRAMRALAQGDAAYNALFLPGADRPRLIAEALAAYREARARYERIVLAYYTEEFLAAPLRKNHIDIKTLSDDALDALYRQMLAAVNIHPADQRGYDEQRQEYGIYLTRIGSRLDQIASTSGKTTPSGQ